ncbi:hypothetical protein [Rhodococcus sp. YH1]|uniref:hypothetical protein n=1 Tax=Rhodococcus sp. YH1 TaxID=89066 RepID=UPI001387088E|nr:hypothetical protein [Rhodococcus sp. YH1]
MSTTDLEAIVTKLALVAALKNKLADVEKTAKAELAANLTRGTVYAFDGIDDTDTHQLGYASVPKPTQPKPVVEIDDEARVLPWAIDEFGDSAATYRLTEQGLASVKARALAAHKAAGSPERFEFDGVVVTVPAPRPSTPRFTASKNVDALVEDMVRTGRLNITDVLALPAPPAN